MNYGISDIFRFEECLFFILNWRPRKFRKTSFTRFLVFFFLANFKKKGGSFSSFSLFFAIFARDPIVFLLFGFFGQKGKGSKKRCKEINKKKEQTNKKTKKVKKYLMLPQAFSQSARTLSHTRAHTFAHSLNALSLSSIAALPSLYF
jgi:hypothetical protein